MKHALFYAIGPNKIQDGIIRGVSVVTKGEAKGHGLLVDDTSLQTFLSAASGRTGGVPVKMDHKTGFNHIVGKLENFRIEGDSLRADLQLLKAHEAYPRIVEMAETMAESFGLSASFEYTLEKGGKSPRVSELNSVDLVDQPAANPNGLFQQAVDSSEKGMTFESFFSKFRGAVVETENAELATVRGELTSASTKVAELEKKSADFATQLAAKEKEIADLKTAQAEFDKKVEAAASQKALDITASIGQQPVTSVPASAPAAQKADFSKLTGIEKTKAAFVAQLKSQKA